MDIRFSVRGQSLTSFASELVSDTVGYLCAAFTFSPDWNGLDKWAHLSDEDDRVYDAEIIDGRTQPLNLSAGRWRLWVHGHEITDGRPQVRITTGTVTFRVSQSGALEGEVLPVIETSVSEQVAANAAYAKEVAERILQDAEELLSAADEAKGAASAARSAERAAAGHAQNASGWASSAAGFASAAQDAAGDASGFASEAADSVDDARRARNEAATAQREAAVSEHNAEVWAEGGFLEAHSDEIIVTAGVNGAKYYRDEAKQAASESEAAQKAAAGSATAAASSASSSASSESAAQAAKSDAEAAKSKAETAQSEAEKAQAAAEDAQGKAEDAQSAAEGAKTAAETAKGEAEAARDAAAESAAQAAQSAQEAGQSDWSENDSTKASHILNRPFFDKGPSGTVKWDDENEPVAVVEYGGNAELNLAPSHLYLMPRTTDHVPTYEELETLGGSVTYQTGANDFDDSGMIPVLAAYKFGAGNGNLDPIIFAANVTGNATWVGTQVLVVHEANTPLENVVIEKPGVYFASDLLGGSYFYPTRAIEMTLTGGTLDDGLERLPEKFLPDSVATKEYVDQKLEEGGGADLSEILEEVDVGTVWESDGQTVEFETAGGVPVYKLPNSIAPLLTQTVKFTGGVISSSGDKTTADELEKVPPANNISAVATSYDLGNASGLFVVVSEDASVTIDSSSNGINGETFEMKQGVYFFGVYSLYWHQHGKTAWYTLQFSDSYTAEKLKPAYLPSSAATKQYVDEKVANAGGSADLSEILEETEATTWTTKGEEAAIIVPMYDGGTVSLYKMPSAVGTVLPQEIEVTTKEVYDDGYVNEDVYLTEAHEAFRGEGVTLFDLQPVGIIAVVTKAGTVDFTDAQVEISEPGVYFYDKRSWENPIEGVQYATMKFTMPYSEVRLKESILPATAATKQYVDEKATWENLQGKPTIFEGGDTLTWDGDTAGRVCVVDAFYKVSEAAPTSADLANGVTVNTLTSAEPDDLLNTYQIPLNGFLDVGNGILFSTSPELVAFISVPGAELDGIVFPESGTYLVSSNGMHVSSLTILGYTGFGKEVIDPDYLPESVKGGSGGVAYVNFAMADPMTADKTFAEVDAAVSEGKAVFGIYAGVFVLSLIFRAPGECLMFSVLAPTGDTQAQLTKVTWLADDSITAENFIVTITAS